MAKEQRNKFKGIPPPHVGEILKKYIKQNRLYQAGWARKQGVLPTTVLAYFKKSSMQISTLFTICQVLEFNFFKAIADALPPEMPPQNVNPLQPELDQIKKENEALKMENDILKKLLNK